MRDYNGILSPDYKPDQIATESIEHQSKACDLPLIDINVRGNNLDVQLFRPAGDGAAAE